MWDNKISITVVRAPQLELVEVIKEVTLEDSKDSKDSRNLWKLQGQKGTQTSEVMNIDRCDQCLKKTSKFREHSTNSWGKADAPVLTQEDVSSLSKCKDIYSKSSRNLSSCVGKNVSVPKFSWFKSMSQIVGLTAAGHQDKVEGSPMGTNTASTSKTNITSVHSEFNFFL